MTRNGRMRSTYVAGLDIGTSLTCAVIGELSADAGQEQAGGEFAGASASNSIGHREEHGIGIDEQFAMVVESLTAARRQFNPDPGVIIGITPGSGV